jgi:hypothetical protein
MRQRTRSQCIASATAKTLISSEKERRGTRPRAPSLALLRAGTPPNRLIDFRQVESRGVQIASDIIGALSEAALRVAHLSAKTLRLLASDNAALCHRPGLAPAPSLTYNQSPFSAIPRRTVHSISAPLQMMAAGAAAIILRETRGKVRTRSAPFP